MKSQRKVLGAVLICCALVLAFTACAGCTDNNSASSSEILTESPNVEYSPLGSWEGHPLDHTYAFEFNSLSNGKFSMTLPRSEMTAESLGLDALGYSGDIKSMSGNARLEKQDKNTYSVIQTSVTIKFYNGEEMSYDMGPAGQENVLGYFILNSNDLMRYYLKRGGEFNLQKTNQAVVTSKPTSAPATKSINLLGKWKGNSGTVQLTLNVASSNEGYLTFIYPDKLALASGLLGEDSGLTGYVKTVGTSVSLTKIGDNTYHIAQTDMYVDTYTGTSMSIPKSYGMNANGGTLTALSDSKIKFTEGTSGMEVELSKI